MIRRLLEFRHHIANVFDILLDTYRIELIYITIEPMFDLRIISLSRFINSE